ncbi:MAG: bifunctional phosphopantothenoylcysteine decarboxylase/phosphopantothenate--cysteine ligase CoaBC [Bacteroidota bacterium]
MRLKGKHILIGVTGSIAAYKAATLIRLLVKEGAEVKVVMTPLAKEFITPLTLATLSKNPILVDFFNPENGDWNSHVDLGLWSDLYLIAPASANTIAKMATGVADNLLLTTYLSARCPVMVAPAMDLDMYSHQATQQNIKILESRGNIIIEASTGELASGLSGKGRMEEPENILEQVVSFFLIGQRLSGVRALVTSGPTYEHIDPVRFIGNHSSGKMGSAIALELARQGALVDLVSGPVAQYPIHPNINIHKVTSAAEMFKAAQSLFEKSNVAILAAAVADFTAENVATQKIKRQGDELILKLKPTEDIAAHLGKVKKHNQFLIGFALETTNELENAKAKLERKNLDLIVLNSMNDPGAGFGSDTNKVTFIKRNGQVIPFDTKPKGMVAKDITNAIFEMLHQNAG